jgi:hypothetical protein
MIEIGHILGQGAPAAKPPLLSADTIFWASILLIFVLTIVSALLRRLAKDKALKLFNDYHVAFFSERRPPLWGDMIVFSQGVEIIFDDPYTTRRGVVKSSALIYEDEFNPMIAFTRSVHGLTEKELKDRERQIYRTSRPNVLQRFARWFRNLLNTLRDAISKTIGLVIGRMTAGGAGAAAVISTQAGDINTLTGTVVGLAANAYEPLLERYIGRPVVVEINLPPPPGPPPPPNWIPEVCEFPGYLVDYTQKFVAVFNVDHTPVETITVKLEPGKVAEPDLADLKFVIGPDQTRINCTGKDAFVLRQISCRAADGAPCTTDLGIALIPGTNILLAPINEVTTLVVERTRQIDLVVPRNRARIRFGAIPSEGKHKRRRDWLGIAPLIEPKEFLQTIMGRRGRGDGERKG